MRHATIHQTNSNYSADVGHEVAFVRVASRLSISPVSEEDIGQYWCQVLLENGTLFTGKSNVLTLDREEAYNTSAPCRGKSSINQRDCVTNDYSLVTPSILSTLPEVHEVPVTTTDLPVPASTTDLPVLATTTDLHVPATTTDLPVPATTTDNIMHVPATITDLPMPATTTDLPVPATTTDLPVHTTTTDLFIQATTTDLPVTATTTDLPVQATTTDLPVPATITPTTTQSTTLSASTTEGFLGPEEESRSSAIATTIAYSVPLGVLALCILTINLILVTVILRLKYRRKASQLDRRYEDSENTSDSVKATSDNERDSNEYVDDAVMPIDKRRQGGIFELTCNADYYRSNRCTYSFKKAY